MGAPWSGCCWFGGGVTKRRTATCASGARFSWAVIAKNRRARSDPAADRVEPDRHAALLCSGPLAMTTLVLAVIQVRHTRGTPEQEVGTIGHW
jgi:hypothetical protein